MKRDRLISANCFRMKAGGITEDSTLKYHEILGEDAKLYDIKIKDLRDLL